MMVALTAIVVLGGAALLYRYEYRHRACDGENCYYNTYISRNVYLHDHGDGKAWVKNTLTGKKTLTGISWVSKPLGEKDSLIYYNNGSKRGYFNKYTGEVEIPAIYNHAWVFSDGIASVEEDGVIKFIDTKGNQVFDRSFAYNPEHAGYIFHGGYCIIDENDDNKYGLMNTKGVTVLPEEYDNIRVSCDLSYWTLTKDGESGVFDSKLNTVLPMMACSIFVHSGGIDVTMPDNTLRKYDLEGNIINDFYVSDFERLEYDLEETYLSLEEVYDEYNTETVQVTNIRHKTAYARLCKYYAGNLKEGLMTPEGHMVTLPKYEDITAIGPDTYLCTINYEYKEILNGKGQIVK